MYLLMYQLDKLIRGIAGLILQAPDPGGAARWCLQELAGRTGLCVVVLGHHAAPSSRLQVAGEKGVLEALREGLADRTDAVATSKAAWELVGSLQEELMAFDQGEDYDGGVCSEALTLAWGATVPPR